MDVVYEAGWENWLMSDEYPEFKEMLTTVKQKMSTSKAKGGGKSKNKSKIGAGKGSF